MKIKHSKQKEVRQTITFKENLYQRSLKRAEFVGLSYPEYLRNLVVNDLSLNGGYLNGVENLKGEDETSFGEALEDVKKGRVRKIKNIKDYVDSL